jgi:outer membrane protein TolC
MNASKPRPALLATASLALLMLSGCASFSADGGFTPVSAIARNRLDKDLSWARTDADRDTIAQRVVELLAKPLSVDDAVQLALLNNRGLQASFAELSVSEADLVQAGRLTNPHFSMLRASKLEGGAREFKIEQALTVNIFALVTMPLVTGIERRRFEQTQRSVGLEMLRLAADTRKAYYVAVAAEESIRYATQVLEAADASAELARRMAQVGNWSKLQQAREQGFYADAALKRAIAERSALIGRERLTRLLGLWGQQIKFELPQRLPDLPKSATDLPDVEQMAISQRLDLQNVRAQVETLAKNLGLTKTTRFINVLEFGPARVLEGARDSDYKKGFEVSFELPLFDWGGARVTRAEAQYMQAIDLAAEAAINARSEVREAYHGYRSSYELARHYRDEIVPIRKRISDENLLRYNGMLIGVFELLADARSQITSVNSYIESLRDFWIAQADLEMSLIGKPNVSLMPKAGIESAAAAGH